MIPQETPEQLPRGICILTIFPTVVRVARWRLQHQRRDFLCSVSTWSHGRRLFFHGQEQMAVGLGYVVDDRGRLWSSLILITLLDDYNRQSRNVT
jgi:hypothetical protein